VATKPVDFRKGMDGLAALVKEQLQADPFSASAYDSGSTARCQGISKAGNSFARRAL
jgi:hypothetical protein